MKTVDTWSTRSGKIKFEIYHEKATDVHVFVETKFSKAGGIKTKVTQAHKTECQRMFERAVLQSQQVEARRVANENSKTV